MNPKPQTQTAPLSAPATTGEATDFDKLLQKPIKEMTFVPFGDQDKIKLTPRIIMDLIAVKTKTGRTCSEQDALRFMMMCQAKRLNPFAGDAYLIGYDTQDGPKFSLITAHQAFLKRAEVHPEYDGMESGVILLNEETQETSDRQGDFHLPHEIVVGGWATVFLKNRSHPIHRRLRMARFNKGFGIWKDDPAGMIVKCGEADGLRSAFPTMVGGLYLREELDFMPDAPLPMSRPLFESPGAKPRVAPIAPTEKIPEVSSPVEQAGSVDNEPRFDREPEPEKTPEPTEAPGIFNHLKALRGLAKMGGIKEPELLEFWAVTGATDGSHSSLEEVQIAMPKLIEQTSISFPAVAEQIKANRGGK